MSRPWGVMSSEFSSRSTIGMLPEAHARWKMVQLWAAQRPSSSAMAAEMMLVRPKSTASASAAPVSTMLRRSSRS
eukprot:7386576-Prymnesium_polylepis.1